MKKEKFIITGMTCSACSSRVEKCVKNLDGVKKVSVNLLTGTMNTEFDENILNEEKIIQNVIDSGYGASLYDKNGTSIKKDAKKNNSNDEIKNMKKNLIYSFVFLIPLMFISMGEMIFHIFSSNPPVFMQNIFYGYKNSITFAFTQFILLIPIIYINKKYFKNGFKNLLNRSPNMDSLVALGSGASIVYGIFAIFKIGYGFGYGYIDIVNLYRKDLYFESAAMIVTLISLGKYLEAKSKGKTSEAVRKLMDLAPKRATIEVNGKEKVIPIEELSKGDTILVKPGESIPADGIIIYGTADIDESAVTGESIPVFKKVSDKVISASINKTGFIKVKAEEVSENSTISKIIKLVDEASASKAPIAEFADKVAGIFVPAVISISILVFIIWIISGATLEFSLSTAISVLVISCPCALGLATPVAIMVGTGKGAENGILIKSGEILQKAHEVDTVVLDKTGTITEGKPEVTDIISLKLDEESILKICAGIENGSEHPLAKAVIKYAKEKKIEKYKIDSFNNIPGKGIEAAIYGKSYYLGNTALIEEKNIYKENVIFFVNKFANQGKTPIILADEKEVLGIIAIADVEKESSRKAIKLLKKMKMNVVMLTGDNKKTAEAVKKRIDVDNVIAEVLPEDKEKHVSEIQKKGHKVAMIGDGINDAPALARADVGIAIGSGTDIAIESADAVLIRNDLLDAVSCIKLSSSVIKNIKENLFWALFYNVISIPLAAGVLYPLFQIKLSPMIGAAAMSMSSVCVVLNALRLRNLKFEHFENRKEEKNNMKYELNIEGMMCEHCKKHVEDALNGINGVKSVNVELDKNKAFVESDRDIKKEEFIKVIESAGYKIVY
ncbi:heavy metal translocating P-type ATPase [Clostridium sp. BJN0001]|uniref:heavy metal translocating P-type ATPase n=1 Tax=Clostridium sp. BJN0001 TaxID=2930219 RepID=UPI001FD1EC91|nr:heavy metal translocating P-type ATPase [Clostridium sp. BJN0001]